MLNNKQIKDLFGILTETIKDPETELQFSNNYTLTVAVILSAQAKDVMVNIATEPLFKIVDTPEKMLLLGEEKLIEYIKIIGLYKNKAKNIMLMSQQLIDKHNSIIPDNFEDLIQLAGVGRKTANVILNVAFKQDTMAVDTHVFRVSRRMGLSAGKDVLQVEKDLLEKIPNPYRNSAHHLLILHGRYTCKAKGFDCTTCLVNKICERNF
ncbi:MAG: endonuclease III [Alphaproteobacteria bacterium]|jgi:endonuclease-3|nr:endonuclease III [Alphaproteobacteria bacterium]